MKITQEDMAYLRGEKFSNGYQFRFTDNPLYTRTEMIVNICRGKRVLHVGCCDHLPLIEKKIRDHVWLHGLLDENCTDVLGVDINEEAIHFVNEKRLSKTPVIYADITSENFVRMIPHADFDYVLMGEIVEHLDNPVLWLGQVKNNMKEVHFEGKYLITVPNAFRSLNLKLAGIEGVEAINSDHRYWFTPWTISKIMLNAGIIPEEILFCGYSRAENWSGYFFRRKMVRLLEKITQRPNSWKSYRGDTLIAIGKSM